MRLRNPSVSNGVRSICSALPLSNLTPGKLAQFVFGAVIPISNPNAILATIAMAGVVEAGAWQACQQMGDLKTAYLVKAPPKSIFYGQMFGSAVGAFVGTGIYRLYTTIKPIPSDELPVPDAHLWLLVAKLVYGKGLPPQSFNFAIGATMIGAIWGGLRIAGFNRWWRDLVPSGIAVAAGELLHRTSWQLVYSDLCVGMYLPPALTLTRALGGLIHYCARHYFHVNQVILICSASGLILGQGIFSVFNLILGVLGVPHL